MTPTASPAKAKWKRSKISLLYLPRPLEGPEGDCPIDTDDVFLSMIIKWSGSEAVSQDVVPMHVFVPELANSHRLSVLPLVHWGLAASLALPLPVDQETAVRVWLHPHSDLLLKSAVVLAFRVLWVVDPRHPMGVSSFNQPGHPLLLEPAHLVVRPELVLHSQGVGRLILHGIAFKLELFIRTAPEFERTTAHHSVFSLPWSALEEIGESFLGAGLGCNV